MIFDLFHTLVDPEDFRPKEFRRAEAVADLLELDTKKFLEYWESTHDTRLLTPRPEVEYVKDFVAMAGKPTPPSSILREVESALGRYQGLALLNPRKTVLATVKALKSRGLKLGALSNAYERDTIEWLRSPLAPYFDAAVFSHDIGSLKPDPRAYRAVLERVELAPRRCAYVGDGGSHELAGARRVGFMKAFVSRNGLRTKEELEEFEGEADLSVDEFEDLLKVLD